MSLSAKTKVQLPGRGVIVARRDGRRYVYKVLKTYRNDKGQPTNDRKMIGRIDEASGLLVPNDYYWRAFPGGRAVEALPAPGSVRSVGSEFLVGRVLDRLGVTGMLVQALGADRARQLGQASRYMARRGNVMDGLEDWAEQSTLAGPEGRLTGRAASRLFASVSHSERMAFFRQWAAAQGKCPYLAYDVTSFSTRARGMDDAEWGYNRDGQAIPQINLGCYLNQESGLPVFYTTYPGSIVDKSHLPHMTAHNADLGIDGHVTFVLDRGFASTANVGHLHDLGQSYILGVEIRHKAARQALDAVRDTIVAMRHRAGGSAYGQAVPGRYFGHTAILHVYHDPVLAEHRRADLERVVQAESDALAQLDQLTRRQADSYRRHFTIDLNDDGTFAHTPNPDLIDAAARPAGYFAILTNTGLTSRETLDVYRGKDAIEKGFDDLKNHLDMKPLRTWTDETTHGKMFAAFIALIAVSHIQRHAGPALKASKQSVSKRRVLAELDKIKIVETSTGTILMNPATRLQKDILKALGLTETDLQTYVAHR
jgi:transposase